MFCVIDVGHKKTSPGAVNKKTGMSEFEFNNKLAKLIESISEIPVEIIYRTTLEKLPMETNALNPDFVISLHCNAFNKKATGTETLFYKGSIRGAKLAFLCQKNILNCLKLVDRGVKSKTGEDRGGYQLKYTKAPIIISEPFFIDNDKDYQIASNKFNELALAYASTIKEFSLEIS